MPQQQKTFAILGDSYSTFRGYVPEDYLSWYGVPERLALTDVRKVEETWWRLLQQKAPVTLLTNCSFSGSAVARRSYPGLDPVTSSFPYRMKREFGDLLKKGICPDVIIVMAGTNDFWIGTDMGEIKTADWTEEDLTLFAPSFCYMLSYLKESFPDSRSLVVINDAITGANRDNQQKIAALYGVDVLLLDKVDKRNGHPDVRGMQTIADQIVQKLNEMKVLPDEYQPIETSAGRGLPDLHLRKETE